MTYRKFLEWMGRRKWVLDGSRIRSHRVYKYSYRYCPLAVWTNSQMYMVEARRRGMSHRVIGQIMRAADNHSRSMLKAARLTREGE